MAEDQIRGMATSIRDKLGSLPAAFSSNRCIYKVPMHIRKANEECYRSPLTVSIGPIYYGNSSLQASEELKLRHLQCFLEHGNGAHTLEDYLNIIREREDVARDCYSEQITLSSSELIQMVLVDATFVIFFLFSYQFSLENHPPKSKLVEVFSQVERDLFLEENQLPFFILKDLYDLAFGTATIYSDLSFIDLTSSFISNRFICGKYATNVTSRETIERTNIKHLIHFLRVYILSPTHLRKQAPYRIRDPPQYPLKATELIAAGVNLRASESKIAKLLDIQSSDGVLHIPKFIVQDTIESLFRSITYFKICQAYFDSFFLDYIFFLCNLINTPKDVEILVKHGIIENWLSSDEDVADLFNSVTKHVLFHLINSCYSSVTKNLNGYATTSWNK